MVGQKLSRTSRTGSSTGHRQRAVRLYALSLPSRGEDLSLADGGTVTHMVATYIPHMKLAYGGTLGLLTPEEWSNGLRFTVLGNPPNEQQLQSMCDAAVGPLTTWMRSSGASINQAAFLTYAKLNWITATGKQRDQNTILTDITGVRGGSTLQTPPYYQTAAVTFRTRLRRGRGHTGRVFPPAVSIENNPADPIGPYMSVAQASAMATAYRNLIVDLRTAFATALGGQPVPDLVVHSVGNTNTGVPAKAELVIGTVVDRVPDVQHRRTNRIPRAEGNQALLDPAN